MCVSVGYRIGWESVRYGKELQIMWRHDADTEYDQRILQLFTDNKYTNINFYLSDDHRKNILQRPKDAGFVLVSFRFLVLVLFLCVAAAYKVGASKLTTLKYR